MKSFSVLLCFVNWCCFMALMSETCNVRLRESVVFVGPRYVLCVTVFSERHSRNSYVTLRSTLLLFRGIFQGVCIILNDEVDCFKFSVLDNEVYLFLRFGVCV